MLVDAGLVRERVSSHHRLVWLDDVAGEAAHHAAGAGDLLGVDLAPQAADVVGAGAKDHRHLLERGVAGPFADAVDAAFDLPRPDVETGEGVGDREPEVVVAVHRERDLGERRAALVELQQVPLELVRHRVADGVRDVDGGRALVDGRRDDLRHVGDVAARRVLAGEFDVVAERSRQPHRVGRGGEHLRPVHLELPLQVDVARGDERVDARLRGVADGIPAGGDVLLVRAGEPGDDRPFDLAGDRLHALEVTWRRDREARFDDVDAEPRKLVRDLDLLARFRWMPGACSPSRRLVSKKRTRLSGGRTSLGSGLLKGTPPHSRLRGFTCARTERGCPSRFP